MFYFTVFLYKSFSHTCDRMLIVNLAILLKTHKSKCVINQTDLLERCYNKINVWESLL